MIGAGGMGREHLRNLAAMPGVDVEVVADVDPAAADAGAAIVGAAATTDAAHVAAQPSLDGVVIASSDASHAELTLAAIELGTPVLCEKPLAMSEAEAKEIEKSRARLEQALADVTARFTQLADQAADTRERARRIGPGATRGRLLAARLHAGCAPPGMPPTRAS